MNRIFKKAKSLCAVLLSCAVVFASAPKILSADDPLKDPETGMEYVYNVTIEFGSFDFYYDYGVWDSAKLQYKANEASKKPAKDTQNTFPGWYGFDGTANKISVHNYSLTGNAVKVNIDYTDVPLEGDTTDNDITFPLKKGAVTMTCYDDAAFTTPTAGAVPNGCSFVVDGLHGEGEFTTKDIYVSFSGRPVYDDGTDFESAQAQRIGYITLTVSLPDAT